MIFVSAFILWQNVPSLGDLNATNETNSSLQDEVLHNVSMVTENIEKPHRADDILSTDTLDIGGDLI